MQVEPRSAQPWRARPEAGLTLIETIVAMAILSLVVTAVVPLFVGVLQSTSGLGAKQTALAVASQQLEYVRSLDPDHLVAGRNALDVAALIASPGLVDLSSEVTGALNSEPNAAIGSPNAAVAILGTKTLNGTTFTVRTFIDVCYLSKLLGTCTALLLNGPAAYRVSVDVSWPRGPGTNCQSARAGQCEYVSTSLIDDTDDPLFSTTTPPTITSLLQLNGTTSSSLVSLHPNQQVTVQLFGAFAYGATVFAGSGDVITGVSNAGASITATLQTSSVLGSRALSVVNPDGGSASTAYTVSNSSPTVLSMIPIAVLRGSQVTFTLTGADFFAAPNTSAPVTQPTITLTGSASIAGVPTAVSPATSAVTVIGPTSLTFKATFPILATSYSTTGTLTLANPDGGATTYAYTVAVA